MLCKKEVTTHVDPTSEMSSLAVQTARELYLEIAGIDLLYSSNGYVICEANSSPGFRALEECTGIDIATSIMEYVLNEIAPA
jgi:gamma-F420-2:alpha-L-glutamate ligase